ncbi:hypothetical protein TNCV_3751871 [Trichonephila clavipes]|nr:hypothetical protein TNCV_3751871 [Trichonephila clavipes]
MVWVEVWPLGGGTNGVMAQAVCCEGGELRLVLTLCNRTYCASVLIAPRDSILQNVETVIQWPGRCTTGGAPAGIQTHRFFISREIYCIEQLRLYSAEDCDVMLQWTVVLDLEFDDGRRTVVMVAVTELHVTLCFTQPLSLH